MSDILFGNNNKTIINKLSKSSLIHNKRSNLFVILAITLATCMILIVSLYFLGSRQQLKNEAIGRYQAAIRDVDEEVIYILSNHENIEDVGISYSFGITKVDDYKLSLQYFDETLVRFNKYSNLDGQLPQKSNEVVVTTSYLEHIQSSAGIGDKIVIPFGNMDSEYIITGILPLENTDRNFNVIVSKDLVESKVDNPLYTAYFRILDSDNIDADSLKVIIQNTLDDMGIDENSVLYSSHYFWLIEQQTTTELAAIVVACAIVALACAIVVYSLFYVTVIGKINEYGRLRIIGTTKRQIKKILFQEGIYLSTIAIPIGALLGAILGFIIVPEGWNTPTTLAVAVIASLVMYLTVAIAIYKPVQLAAKITPVESVSYIGYSDFTKYSNTKKLQRKITPNRFAVINLSRSRKKTIFTIASLSISGILLISSSAYLNSIDFEGMARNLFPYGEIKVELGINGPQSYYSDEYIELQKNNYLDDGLIESILTIEGVKDIKEYVGIVADVKIPSIEDIEPFVLDGYGKEDVALFESYLDAGITDYDTLAENNGIVVNGVKEWEEIFGWDVQIGDKLYVEKADGSTVELQVMGILDSSIKHGGYEWFFIPKIILNELQDVSNLNYQLVVQTEEGKTDFIEEEILNLISSNPDLDLSTLREVADAYENTLKNQKAPIYILVMLIGTFGIINLFNTLITNILARKQEISVFQALGLTNKQLSHMQIAEGVLYLLGTAIITLIIGTGAGYLLCHIFNNMSGTFGTVAYRFPILEMTLYFSALLFFQMLFSIISIRLFRNQSLVDRMRNL